MKRKIELFLLTLIMAFAFSACGGGGHSSSGDDNPPPAAVVTISIAPLTAAIQTGQTLALTATVSQGNVTWPAAPQNATLVTNGKSATFSASTAGSYAITVTADDDPAKTATATINVTTPAVVPVTVAVTPTSASITTGETVPLSATVNQGSVTWATGSGATITPSGTSAVFTSNTPGVYQITATSTVDSSKSAVATITVNSPAAVVSSITLNPQTSNIQVGSAVSLTASVNTGSITWTPLAGLTVNGMNATFTPAAAGIYTVTITSTVDTSKTASATITVTPQPPVVTGLSVTTQTLAIQTGATITLTASVNTGSVTWTPQAGLVPSGMTAQFTPPAAGTYTVTITSTVDTSQSASATITVTDSPPVVTSITLTPQTANIQTGDSVPLAASVNTGSVAWTPQAGLVVSNLDATFTPTAAGSYTITVTSTVDASKTASATITVTDPPVPVTIGVSPTTASVASGDTVILTATVSAGSVNWSTDVNATITPSGDGLSASFTSATPGNHTVTVTSVTDTTKTATATITVNPAVVNPPRDSLAEWMQSGTYYYELVGHMESTGASSMAADINPTSYQAKDGNKCANKMTLAMTLPAPMTTTSGSITVPSWTYAILYDQLMYVKTAGNAAGCVDSGGSVNLATKIGEGTGVIAAGTIYEKTLPYEEYSASGLNGSTKTYFENGSVYGFSYSSTDSGTTTTGWQVIINASQTPPAGIFDVPSGFTELSIPTPP